MKCSKRTCLMAGLSAVPFLVVAGLTIADALGRRPFGRPLRYHAAILFDLFVLWAVVFGLILAIGRWRRVAGFLRARWKHCLLAGVTTVLALAVLEVALRILVPAMTLPLYDTPFSRAFHHIHAPRVKMFGGLFEGSAVLIETNEDGLRTPHSRENFLKFKDRVVVLGDSFPFGFGVQVDEAFPAVMERELRRTLGREDLGVLDAGVVSYSPLLERNLFDRLIVQYRPTLTLMVIDMTDIGDDYQYGERLKVSPDGELSFRMKGRGMKSRWHDGVALAKIGGHIGRAVGRPFALVKEFFAEAPREDQIDYYKFAVRVGGTIETNRFFILRHPLAETLPFFEASYEHIRRTAEAAREAGSEFLVVVIPRYHHWNDRECPNNWEGKNYRVDEPYEFEYLRFFDQMAESSPFEIFSLLPTFQQSKEFPLVFNNDPHWNRKGQELAGKVLAEHVRARYLRGP